jgi:hypothetical protein
MAYTTARRDHVWVIVSDGTAGGVTIGGATDAQERVRTIRWLPAAASDTVTIDRIKSDGTTETVWEDNAGGTGALLGARESRLDLRFTYGFKVVMSNGGKLYLYEMLDAPGGR